MASLDFYYDYRSPYAYLANTQLQGMSVDVAYHPFEIGRLMKLVNNVPTSVTSVTKNRYVQTDLRRWVEHYGVPFRRHPTAADIDGRRLLRATHAAGEEGRGREVAAAIFEAYWATSAPLVSAEDVAVILDRHVGGGRDWVSRIDDPALDVALDEATRNAAGRGVFGAPTLFVGDEMFFGNDRLDFVRKRLALA